jgi:hypothetical protein
MKNAVFWDIKTQKIHLIGTIFGLSIKYMGMSLSQLTKTLMSD